MVKKIGKTIQCLSKIWSAVVICAAIVLLGLRFIPVLFGYTPIWCRSDSMSPTFHRGALCYVDENYDAENIQVGDIIAYQMTDGSLVTHRVHRIDGNKIITKGDANDNVDFAPIVKEQIVGKNVMQIEYLGNLFKEFPNMLLINMIIFAITVMLFLDLLSKMLLEKEVGNEKEIEMDNSNHANFTD